MFLLSCLWARVLFDSSASHSFVAASCVKELGLKVETLEELLHVKSPLGNRVRIDQICRNYELEISEILLTVDLKVMDMSEFDVILRMDWLMVLLTIFFRHCYQRLTKILGTGTKNLLRPKI